MKSVEPSARETTNVVEPSVGTPVPASMGTSAEKMSAENPNVENPNVRNPNAEKENPSAEEPIEEPVELRNRWLAALLTWLIPGMGQLYQRRFAKGIVFLIAILGTFWFGCWLASDPQIGAARCVSVPMAIGETRLMIYCQSLVGLSAMPAGYQAGRVEEGLPPRWNGFMAPAQPDPDQIPSPNSAERSEQVLQQRKLIASALADQPSTSRIGFVLRSRFEFGGVFTLIAGLLNLLAILDAFGGPVRAKEEDAKERDAKPT